MKFAFFAICAFGFGGLGAAGYQQFGSWSNPLTGAPLAAAPVAHAASVVNPTAAFNDVRAKLQSGDFAKIPVAAPLQPPLPRMERFDPFKSGALDPKDLEKFKNIHVNGARASVSHQFNQTNSVRNSLPGPQPFPRR